MKMILASHGTFCTGLLDSYQMIAGRNEQLMTISLTDAGIDDFSRRFNALVDDLIETEQLLILTDIKGGTPYNVALSYFLAHNDNVRLISGMNLPMVIEAGLALQNDSLEEVYNKALEVGQASIEGSESLASQEEDIEF